MSYHIFQVLSCRMSGFVIISLYAEIEIFMVLEMLGNVIKSSGETYYVLFYSIVVLYFSNSLCHVCNGTLQHTDEALGDVWKALTHALFPGKKIKKVKKAIETTEGWHRDCG